MKCAWQYNLFQIGLLVFYNFVNPLDYAIFDPKCSQNTMSNVANFKERDIKILRVGPMWYF